MIPTDLGPRRRLVLSVAAVFCFSCVAFAQKKAANDMELPLSAEQTAQAIGVQQIFERLKVLADHPDPANRSELMDLQQEALLQVTTASLQVDAASGQIEAEIGEVKELGNFMSSKRDGHVDTLNLFSLGIGGVAGTASSALGLTVHDKAAAITGIVAGSATAVLTLAAFLIRRGEGHELMVQSNMLSKVFEHPSDVNNVYPPVVVAFMNSIAPNDEDGLSRQDRLIKSWVEVGRIPELDTPKGQEKINRLTSLPGQKVQQTIADLDDRQAMLYDLRTRLNYMKQDLAILLASVPRVSMHLPPETVVPAPAPVSTPAPAPTKP